MHGCGLHNLVVCMHSDTCMHASGVCLDRRIAYCMAFRAAVHVRACPGVLEDFPRHAVLRILTCWCFQCLTQVRPHVFPCHSIPCFLSGAS